MSKHSEQPQAEATQVSLTESALQEISERVSTAVREGIKGVMTEETAAAFWAAGLAVLQKQATQHAGRFVLGGFMVLTRKASMFLLLGGIFYAIGGWAGLALLFKSLFDVGR